MSSFLLLLLSLSLILVHSNFLDLIGVDHRPQNTVEEELREENEELAELEEDLTQNNYLPEEVPQEEEILPFSLVPRIPERMGFIHSRKTGGTGLLNPLRNWAGKYHSGGKFFKEDNLWVQESCGKGTNKRIHRREGDFWITVVREPVSRVESHYLQKKGEILMKDEANKEKSHKCDGRNVLDFVNKCPWSSNLQVQTVKKCLQGFNRNNMKRDRLFGRPNGRDKKGRRDRGKRNRKGPKQAYSGRRLFNEPSPDLEEPNKLNIPISALAESFDLAWDIQHMTEGLLIMAVLVPDLKAESIFIDDHTANRRSIKTLVKDESLEQDLMKTSANVDEQLTNLKARNRRDQLFYELIQHRFERTIDRFGRGELKELLDAYSRVNALVKSHYLDTASKDHGLVIETHDEHDEKFNRTKFQEGKHKLLTEFTVHDFLTTSDLVKEEVKTLNVLIDKQTERLTSLHD